MRIREVEESRKVDREILIVSYLSLLVCLVRVLIELLGIAMSTLEAEDEEEEDDDDEE